MNKNKLLFIVLATLFLFTVCQQTDKEKETIAKIDTHLVYLNQTIKQITSMPADSLAKVYKEKLLRQVEELYVMPKNKLEKDSIIFGQFLDYTTILGEKFYFIQDYFPQLIYTKQQLESLRADLLNSDIPDDSIDFYLNTETIHLNNLKRSANEILELQTLSRKYYNSEKFVDSILSKK